MTDLETWLIIILVVGVIASNLAVLKYSAKFKMTQFGKDHKKSANSHDDAQGKQSSDSQQDKQTDPEKKQSNTASKKDDDKDSDGFW
ncbi:DUF2897 family protein [Shewanella nanhaiensis]|uniref:DUF2897 family protein n=1 Tax=Shewanella nanhaiensis TaxID=2864872 RepID=A0ABS7E511_9GAMM|nr:DUF2897 family protein [Shewanella nanhaiensis]MBW8184773.1 DUF2897 family protein [Shewanella nanhaiensis]